MTNKNININTSLSQFISKSELTPQQHFIHINDKIIKFEIKLITKIHLEKDKFAEISVPYRTRVGDAEINTWGDGWKNFKFFFAKRIGINKTRTELGPLDDSLDSIKDT